ncbi:hypothetical protein BD311DRAFT_647818 [Dichomitus squalens]|uniref:Uncharacterized protein n=1 Tax=Dichomitus squalens TaxID=114155 RepID=A0A4Q9N6K1_9APHY|nr:hypothetical protein BD311DRAFT_647818 [Dichomitus squalens]
MTFLFGHSTSGTQIGLGWTPLVHPEGFVYFKYKHLKDIEDTLHLVLEELRNHGVTSDDVEIGLDIYFDPTAPLPVCHGCYYLCNRESRQAFWLEYIQDEFFFEGEQHIQILGGEHLRLAAESAFWYTSVSDTDKETAKTTTVPYTADDLHRFLQLIKDINVTRLLKSILTRERFVRYHGEPFVQLDSDRNIRLEVNECQHSYWFSGASCLFFFTPHIYLDRLHKIWFDNKVNYPNWRKFNRELQDDWTASITPSTVILSANVGFLAIQSVDQGGKFAADRTTGQIVSYIIGQACMTIRKT